MSSLVLGAANALRWRMETGIAIAFSTRGDGCMRDPANRSRFGRRLGLVLPPLCPGQVHGNHVAVLDSRSGSGLAQADGLALRRPIPPIAVFGADCPGLVLAAPDAAGIAHCGWRGIASGIVDALVAAIASLSAYGRREWSACVGPGIGAAAYEVDRAVLDARRWPASALITVDRDHALLDLAATISHDLAQAGISDVLRSGVRTDQDPRLHSYRRHGSGGTQALIAWEAPHGHGSPGVSQAG